MGFFQAEKLQGDSTAGKRTYSLPQCGRCGLYKKCQSPKMPPSGRGNRKILFVGEAPGEVEDRRNTQLVGPAGVCLRNMLEGIVDLEDCTKTNAAICRPPSNDMDDLYLDCCRPNLINTIKEHKPNVIILLGMSAVKSAIAPEWGDSIGDLGQWVGWAIPSPTHNAWLCPTYHPSYVLRTNEDRALVRIVREHLKRAVALEFTPVPQTPLQALQDTITVCTDPRDTQRRLITLNDREGLLGFDYETPSLKPENPAFDLFSVAFSLNGVETFSGRLDKGCYPALSAVLKNPKLKKIASNLKFEERWSIAKLGHGVTSWFFDTMLASHILDNRKGITGLKFQTYINFGIGDYSSRIKPFLEGKGKDGGNLIHQAPLRELLIYGGMDALLEYKLAVKQMERASWLK